MIRFAVAVTAFVATLKLPPVEATIGHGGTTVVDKGYRRSIVRWVPWSWAWLRRELEWRNWAVKGGAAAGVLAHEALDLVSLPVLFQPALGHGVVFR